MNRVINIDVPTRGDREYAVRKYIKGEISTSDYQEVVDFSYIYEEFLRNRIKKVTYLLTKSYGREPTPQELYNFMDYID